MARDLNGPEAGGNPFANTSRFLTEKARFHQEIIVSFSGGKDSLAVLDLCRKAFKRVVCFTMYFVPGLKFDADTALIAKEKYGCETVFYPHWAGIKAMQRGIYCPDRAIFQDFPEWNLHDIHQMVIQDTGIDLIAHGGKEADSMWRRRMLNNAKGRKEVIYPLLHWNKWEVISYLQRNNIELRKQDGTSGSASGIDLSTEAVLWLHDEHPEDYATLEKWFPYVGAVVARREMYGIGRNPDKDAAIMSKSTDQPLQPAAQKLH